MITYRQADFSTKTDADALCLLMNAYATDPMGGNTPIPDAILHALPELLAERDDAFSIIAWDADIPIGLATCFVGFSTLAAREMVNVHDLVVRDSHPYQGIGKALLTEVEQVAQSRGACKVTLEVLQNNAPARKAYKDKGFVPYELAPGAGVAEFWHKKI